MRRLIVVVPGILGPAGWDALVTRLSIEPSLADAHWLRWDHRKRWYSTGRPDRLARDLRARIDQECAARGPFDDIILVGHSFGGLLARQAYLLASGIDHTTRQPSPWAGRVSRIILFAGVNRGLNPRASLVTRIWIWVARAFPPVRRMLAWHLMRGSDFVTNLRIEWIRHFAGLGGAAPVVVQLLGTRDTLVTRDDSVDIEQFPTAYYIEIPEATHGDLHTLDSTSDPDGRYALLRDAFVHERPLKAQNVKISGPGQVVFVLHGIRADNRTWVQQAVAEIKRRWPDVETIAPGYGYFSAIRFAVPMIRRRYLRWFQDAYSEALARNPRAQFSFIGHSNGTYLFGEGLRAIPGMRFERAVLVGSVLPADYDWDERVRRGQLKAMRVDGSSHDWPVGWLCSALRGAGMRDIGTGGFEGFTTFARPEKQEFFWYSGGHSAPLSAANVPALAEFAVTGTVVAPAQLGTRVSWFSIVSRSLQLMAPAIVAGAVIVIAYAAWVNPVVAVLSAVAALVMVFVLDVV